MVDGRGGHLISLQCPHLYDGEGDTDPNPANKDGLTYSLFIYRTPSYLVEEWILGSCVTTGLLFTFP